MGRKRIRKIKIPSYKFKILDRVIYNGGLYEKYKKQECTILERSKTYKKQYYKIEFEDGFSFQTIADTLESK